MKRILIFCLLFFLLLTAQRVSAQERYANCDQCGLCQLDGVIQPTPGRYENCRKCLYPGTRGLETLRIVPDVNTPPTPYLNRSYTMMGCLSTDSGEFTVQMSRLFFSIVGGIAFLFLLYGAATVATSQANPEKLNHGKRIVYGAIVGLLFVLFSTFIIRFIAVNVLKIPGFGG